VTLSVPTPNSSPVFGRKSIPTSRTPPGRPTIVRLDCSFCEPFSRNVTRLPRLSVAYRTLPLAFGNFTFAFLSWPMPLVA
jgi:hypothetical protein